MITKRIALFGAATPIGKSILNEALARGYFVTAIVSDVDKVTTYNDNLKVVEGNIEDAEDVSVEVEDHDVVINAEYPDSNNVPFFLETTSSLIEGMKNAGVKRLIAVESTPDPNSIMHKLSINKTRRVFTEAHRKALELYKNEKELDWSYSHPTAPLESGKKTGKVHKNSIEFLTEIEGAANKISFEDYAVALLDEVEKNEHIKEPFAVTY